MILHRNGNKPSTDLEAALAAAISGEVKFDAYTRHLFSTDASMYAIEPIGVVFPRDADDVVAAVETAARFGVPVLPRGAGTSLCGQTVGQAVVLDFSRHMNRIISIDPESRTARVQPGVVQDNLNKAADPHGLLFAPDTSTSARATIGGMIGNNSCGARSARYGMTIDHVVSIQTVLSDGSLAELGEVTRESAEARGRLNTLEGRIHREIPRLIDERSDVIRRGMPPHWRRSGGYRVERMLPEYGALNLGRLVVGSEGTLAVTTEATVSLIEKPRYVAALIGHFDTLAGAIAASESAMECGAMAVELMDNVIVDLARQSPVYRHLANGLHGDPAGLLWVEFYGDTPAEAAAGMERLREVWTRLGHGYALVAAPTPAEQKGFRDLRKAGQGLLMKAGQGKERSLAFVEDTAVPPEHLAEYAGRFSDLLTRHGLRAGFYGHASAGCLHIRPYMDLTRAGEVEKLREVAELVCDLVAEYGGSNSSEHGDGLVRSEFNRKIFGDELYETMREVKAIFDPENRMNPGKKVDSPKLTDNIREPALPPAPPLQTFFHFEFEDGMRGAANSCMRIGECRKSTVAGGTMCPSYMATLDEEHSTRGRANALVKALSSPDPRAALADERLHEVLDLCLECKACQTECPLSVDMATMKSEALAQHHEIHGTPLRSKLFGHVRSLNQLGARFAPISNIPGRIPLLRALMEKVTGIDRRRPLPQFQSETVSKWFRSRRGGPRKNSGARSRGPLIFLADSFTSYTEPEIGKAAVEMLEAAGWEVELVDNVCCGRSFISKGLLKEAKAEHARLIDRLAEPARRGVPIAGCEPSCVLTLKDELPGLMGRSADIDAIADRAVMVDALLAEALQDGSLPTNPDAEVAGKRIVFHGHCHQKAGGALPGSVKLLTQIPGAQVDVLDAGCCGMAGSFGFETEHYDISMKVGGLRLFPALRKAPDDSLVAATGVSCRQQIGQGTGRKARHPISILRDAVRLPGDRA